MDIVRTVLERANMIKQDVIPEPWHTLDDDLLIDSAANSIAVLQERFPHDKDDDNDRLTVDQRRSIINAYIAVSSNKDVVAGLETLRAVINTVIDEVSHKD